MYLLIEAVVLGLSTGVGLLLHRLMPAVGIGTGILIGIGSTALSLFLLYRLIGWFSLRVVEEDEEAEAGPPPTVLPPLGPTVGPRRRKPRRP